MRLAFATDGLGDHHLAWAVWGEPNWSDWKLARQKPAGKRRILAAGRDVGERPETWQCFRSRGLQWPNSRLAAILLVARPAVVEQTNLRRFMRRYGVTTLDD